MYMRTLKGSFHSLSVCSMLEPDVKQNMYMCNVVKSQKSTESVI